MINKNITTYRISVNEIKAQLNLPIDYNKEDTYLQVLIEVATQHISNQCNCDIEQTTNSLITNDKYNLSGLFYNSPLISIDSLKVDGNELETNTLKLKIEKSYFQILDLKAEKEIEIEFTTGYETLPTPLKHAIIAYASDLYDPLRSDNIIGVNIQNTGLIDGLLSSYKRKYW